MEAGWRGGRQAVFAAEDGDVFVVEASPVFELLSSNSIGEVVLATPALADKTLIVRGQNSVFAFENKQSVN